MATSTLIDLSSLQSSTRPLILQVHLALPDFGVYTFPRGAELEAEVENLGEAITVFGSAKLVYTSHCDFCLDEYTASLAVDFNEHLALSSTHDPLGESNVIHDGILDLSDLARQLVNAELPFVSLCRPTCAGLCTTCGMNQNEGTCSCKAATKGDHG